MKEFLAAYGFEGGVSDRGADGKGVFPLLCAVLANDAPLVRALLKAGADPNLAYEGKQREGHFFALHQGTTAVHLAPLSDPPTMASSCASCCARAATRGV